jgi:hypothetical protein
MKESKIKIVVAYREYNNRKINWRIRYGKRNFENVAKDHIRSFLKSNNFILTKPTTIHFYTGVYKRFEIISN